MTNWLSCHHSLSQDLSPHNFILNYSVDWISHFLQKYWMLLPYLLRQIKALPVRGKVNVKGENANTFSPIIFMEERRKWTKEKRASFGSAIEISAPHVSFQKEIKVRVLNFILLRILSSSLLSYLFFLSPTYLRTVGVYYSWYIWVGSCVRDLYVYICVYIRFKQCRLHRRAIPICNWGNFLISGVAFLMSKDVQNWHCVINIDLKVENKRFFVSLSYS